MMGPFAINQITRFFAWIIAGLLVFLNLKLVTEEGFAFFARPGMMIWKILLTGTALGALALLVYVFLHPWTGKPSASERAMHGKTNALTGLDIPRFRRIAVALDFSRNDEKLLAYAIGQGGTESTYILIHIVESASARVLGRQSDDQETRDDQERLDRYQESLAAGHYKVLTRLGYMNRSREIVRIVHEEQADMLVIGAHGHSGLKDFIYGETVNTVRHELKIPVLIVNL
jgi:manganese transport protein